VRNKLSGKGIKDGKYMLTSVYYDLPLKGIRKKKKLPDKLNTTGTEGTGAEPSLFRNKP